MAIKRKLVRGPSIDFATEPRPDPNDVVSEQGEKRFGLAVTFLDPAGFEVVTKSQHQAVAAAAETKRKKESEAESFLTCCSGTKSNTFSEA